MSTEQMTRGQESDLDPICGLDGRFRLRIAFWDPQATRRIKSNSASTEQPGVPARVVNSG
jgi:hypothetical protein